MSTLIRKITRKSGQSTGRRCGKSPDPLEPQLLLCGQPFLCSCNNTHATSSDRADLSFIAVLLRITEATRVSSCFCSGRVRKSKLPIAKDILL